MWSGSQPPQRGPYQPIDPPTRRPTYQPTDQPTNRSKNLPTEHIYPSAAPRLVQLRQLVPQVRPLAVHLHQAPRRLVLRILDAALLVVVKAQQSRGGLHLQGAFRGWVVEVWRLCATSLYAERIQRYKLLSVICGVSFHCEPRQSVLGPAGWGSNMFQYLGGSAHMGFNKWLPLVQKALFKTTRRNTRLCHHRCLETHSSFQSTRSVARGLHFLVGHSSL